MSGHEAGSTGRRQQATYHLHIYPQLSTTGSQTSCRVTATKDSTTTDVIRDAVSSLRLDGSKHYVLVEVKESGGEEWVLDASDSPVHRVLLWPRRAQDDHPQEDGYYFVLQERNADGSIQYVHMQLLAQPTAARRLVERGLLPRPQADFDDLCNLPELTEANLLQNLKLRFMQHKIYTYAGSILVAINPFKFLPIYNPKYVKMYENQQLGKLEPHVFALADVAYYAMLRKRVNQCIVISGESGSGKTQSTNFLIHCLTALSQKGYASGVERTILGAGPVLEVSGGVKLRVFPPLTELCEAGSPSQSALILHGTHISTPSNTHRESAHMFWLWRAGLGETFCVSGVSATPSGLGSGTTGMRLEAQDVRGTMSCAFCPEALTEAASDLLA